MPTFVAPSADIENQQAFTPRAAPSEVNPPNANHAVESSTPEGSLPKKRRVETKPKQKQGDASGVAKRPRKALVDITETNIARAKENRRIIKPSEKLRTGN